jgi:hypothetical protein
MGDFLLLAVGREIRTGRELLLAQSNGTWHEVAALSLDGHARLGAAVVQGVDFLLETETVNPRRLANKLVLPHRQTQGDPGPDS